MAKQLISVKDFGLFCEVVKAAAKIVDSAKFCVGPSGLEIYGARPNKTARCELTSNAVSSAEPAEFSIEKLSQFLKVAQTVKEVHGDDMSGLKFSVDLPFVRFESRKFKTKYATCNELLIRDWVSKKVEAELTPVFEFTSTSDLIKRFNSHAFMFAEPKDVRLYIETKDDMENNAVFGTLGNRETELNNEITFKFGLVTGGSLTERDTAGAVSNERKVIIDLERLNFFNAVQSDAIRFQLMSVNCLVSRTRLTGQDGAFLNLNVYGTILKS